VFGPALPRFDTAEAVGFLDQIFGDVSTGLISLSYITSTGRVRSESSQWIRSAAARAAAWDARWPRGIYFRCTALPPQGIKGGRGSAGDAHCLPFLWADLDYGDVGHKPGPNQLPLPPTEDDPLKIIAGLPTPTLIVHSGGGLYPIWQFDKLVYLTADNGAEAKARSDNWQQVIAAEAKRLGCTTAQWATSPASSAYPARSTAKQT
jgi:putative DNA primase/helicase